MAFEFWLEVLLALLLLVTIGYCLVLDRQLRRLRRAQTNFETLLSDFAAAAERAEVSVGALKGSSAEISRDLGDKIDTASALRDELAMITESGSAIADRIADGVSRGPERSSEAGLDGDDIFAETSGRDYRSESERELLNALAGKP